MDLKLHHINLSTNNVTGMSLFYRDILGLQTEIEDLPVLEKNKGYDYSYSNGDKDGSERNTFNWKMSHNTDANAKISLNLRTAHEKYDFDDVVSWPASATSHLDYVIDSNDTGTRDESQASLKIEKSFTENLSSHQIGLRQTKYESSTAADGKTSDSIKTGLRYLFKKTLDGNRIDQTSTLGSLILEKNYDKNCYC